MRNFRSNPTEPNNRNSNSEDAGFRPQPSAPTTPNSDTSSGPYPKSSGDSSANGTLVGVPSIISEPSDQSHQIDNGDSTTVSSNTASSPNDFHTAQISEEGNVTGLIGDNMMNESDQHPHPTANPQINAPNLTQTGINLAGNHLSLIDYS